MLEISTSSVARLHRTATLHKALGENGCEASPLADCSEASTLTHKAAQARVHGCQAEPNLVIDETANEPETECENAYGLLFLPASSVPSLSPAPRRLRAPYFSSSWPQRPNTAAHTPEVTWDPHFSETTFYAPHPLPLYKPERAYTLLN